MDKKRRQSDLHADLCLSWNANNKKLKPEKIKSYILYKKSVASIKNADNFVVASNDTNVVSVSFNEQSDCKVFTFDKVFCCDSPQNEDFNSLSKSTVQDVIMGLSSCILVCRLTSCATNYFEDEASTLKMDSIDCFTEDILQELLLYTKREENMYSSLHVSYFEVYDDKIVDLFSNSSESGDMKIFETTDQNYIEIQDLVEKPLVDDKDISELLAKQHSHSLMCYKRSCHSILSVSLIKKNVNCDKFEYIKVGKFVMVEFSKCNNNFTVDLKFEDWLLKFAENHQLPSSPKYKIFDILKPAFGGNSKTSIIVTLSSVLLSLENDFRVLQFVSEAQKITNSPEINLKLVLPYSLEEYSEEIQELQKDLNAVNKGSGIKLDSLIYRIVKVFIRREFVISPGLTKLLTTVEPFSSENTKCKNLLEKFNKNSVSHESENVKNLSNYLSSLTESIKKKKQTLISFHGSIETTESEIKDNENYIEKLKLDLQTIENENDVQKLSLTAEEIITMKQMKISNDQSMKELKSELSKSIRNYEGLTRNLNCLESDITSLSCSKSAELTFLRSIFELLVVDMNNALSNFQILQEDLKKKLNNLSCIDTLLKIWRQNIENLSSKFSALIKENCRSLKSIKLIISSSSTSVHDMQNEVLQIIQNNRNENWPVLSCYFHKIQTFCDSSFKILAEITLQLDVIQSCYKAELNAVGTIFHSSSKSYKKFYNDISFAVKFHQHFEEQEKELSEITNIICFQHKFKKQFDENIGDIKDSLLVLKQKCLNHDKIVFHKWNEIEKSCHKVTEKHSQLSEQLSMIQKEMFKYMDNLAQQKSLEYSPLRNKAESVESKILQLSETSQQIKEVIEETSKEHKKVAENEQLKVDHYFDSQKVEVEKTFDSISSKLQMTVQSFFDELNCIQKTLGNSKDELRTDVDSVSSSLFSLSSIYKELLKNSSFILEKSEKSFVFLPSTSKDTTDNFLDFDPLILEWKIPTSTPNNFETKKLDLSREKEKLLCRMKSIAEEQMYQKLNICDLDSEGKENKNTNTSTMSLPNLPTQSEGYSMSKNFSRASKLSKK